MATILYTNEELYDKIAQSFAPYDERRRWEARRLGVSIFPQICETHGETPFRTATGICVKCAQSKRARARDEGVKFYADVCLTHGPAARHDTARGRCQECKAETVRRPLTDGARAVARREGQTTYMANCPEHGGVPHSVAHGRCLTCFNAMGLRRPPEVRTLPARALARREGRTSYLALCNIHGVTAHHTQRGKCLTCFNAAGQRRPDHGDL